MGTELVVEGSERSEAVKAEVRRLGRRVRELRVVAGLTQAQVADRAGVPRSVLSQIEHGSYEVGAGKLAMLAAALSVPTAGLFSVEGPVAGGASSGGLPGAAGDHLQPEGAPSANP